MAAWRRKAIELVPSEAGVLAVEDDLGVSWLLERKLADALLAGDHETAKGILSFVLWLQLHSKNDEWMLHMALQILEASVVRDGVRSQFWRALSPPTFHQLLPLFSGVLKRDVTKEFEREFRLTIR